MKLSTAILSLMSVTSVAAINLDANEEATSLLRRKLKKDKGGGGGGGGGGGCSVNSASPPVEETADDSKCTVCDQVDKNKPSSVTFIYNPAGVNSAYQDECKATCRADTYPINPTIVALDKNDNILGTFPNISAGQSFTVNGSGGDTLDAITNFQIGGWTGGVGEMNNECFLHTSCSQPLVVTDQIGPFIVSAGNECEEISDSPSSSPSSVPSSSPSSVPSDSPSSVPSDSPSSVPSSSPSSVPSSSPSSEPSSAPSSWAPSSSPSLPACIVADKAIYNCGEDISITYNFEGDGPQGEEPRIDDWVGIYPCEVDIYKHAEVWEWTCGLPPATPVNEMCANGPQSEGVILFDNLPVYNAFGPHAWPVAPFFNPTQTVVKRCFKAVLVREDGPSVPPYITVCESPPFEITENDDAGCAIRATSPSIPAPLTR